MIVVDASVLANAVGDDGPDGVVARAALSGNDVSVPDLVDVEVVSVLRRRWLAETMTARRFATAVKDLTALPADRYPALPFMTRAYELRSNVSAYDATYVALAEQLACTLVTADARLGRAHGGDARSRFFDGDGTAMAMDQLARNLDARCQASASRSG